jgi:hypothetical protein
MIKGLFYRFSADEISGVQKKISAQIDAFNKSGLTCKLVYNGNNKKKFNRVLARLPFYKNPDWGYIDEFKDFDYLYFRKPLLTSYFIRSLKELRKRSPNAIFITEIPTYPYDGELKLSIKNYPYLVKERYNRRKLKGLVDRISLVSDKPYSTVFGIPTLQISNGIQFDAISPRKAYVDDIIDLCAVAMFAPWHGYERLLLGMAEYYANEGMRNIIVHFIGSGSEVELYKTITKEKGLKEHVIFHGFKIGDELDELYDKMDMGVGSLGCYKKGIYKSSELKIGEYLAKGLPIITGLPILPIEGKDFRYELQFENNDSIVDIKKIIAFHDSIYDGTQKTCEEVIEEIRQFAKANFDMSATMKPVIDYLHAQSNRK